MFAVPVQNENEQAFMQYIPRDMHSLLHRPETVALGVVDSETHNAAGVLLSKVVGNWLEIMWLYIGETYRRQGGGRVLLDKIIACAHVPEITGVFMQYAAKGGEGIDALASRAGFVCADGNQPLYELTIADLEKNPFWKQEPIGASDAVPLKSIFDVTLREFSAVLESAEQGIALEMPVKWRDYHQEISVAYVKNGEVLGVLLVEREDDALTLSYAYVHGGEKLALPAMLYKAGKAAIALFPPEMPVSVAAINEVSVKLVEKLFQGLGTMPVRIAEYRFANENYKYKQFDNMTGEVLL